MYHHRLIIKKKILLLTKNPFLSQSTNHSQIFFTHPDYSLTIFCPLTSARSRCVLIFLFDQSCFFNVKLFIGLRGIFFLLSPKNILECVRIFGSRRPLFKRPSFVEISLSLLISFLFSFFTKDLLRFLCLASFSTPSRNVPFPVGTFGIGLRR